MSHPDLPNLDLDLAPAPDPQRLHSPLRACTARCAPHMRRAFCCCTALPASAPTAGCWWKKPPGC